VFGSLISSLSVLIPLAIKFVAAINPITLAITAAGAAVLYLVNRFRDLQKEYEDYNKVVGDFEPMQESFIPTTITPKKPKERTPDPNFEFKFVEPIKALNVELKLLKTLTPVIEEFEESLSGMDIVANEITQSFQSFGNIFQSVFAQALQSQEGFFKSFVEGTKRATKALLAQLAATAALNAIIGGLGIGKALGFSNIGGVGGLGDMLGSVLVPSFATGGIVSGPTLGLMGEYAGARTNPEVIAPLNKLKSMIGTNGGSTEVFGVISGADILLSSDRARNNRNRTRGY
jgi:hypothetical protein